jgi:hypothetical protein
LSLKNGSAARESFSSASPPTHYSFGTWNHGSFSFRSGHSANVNLPPAIARRAKFFFADKEDGSVEQIRWQKNFIARLTAAGINQSPQHNNSKLDRVHYQIMFRLSDLQWNPITRRLTCPSELNEARLS